MNGYNNYNNQNNNYRAGKFINPYFTQNQNASYNKNGFWRPLPETHRLTDGGVFDHERKSDSCRPCRI